MFRRCALRYPRAEYRPTTAYEEFFGYSGAKRNANILVVFGCGLFFVLIRLALQANSTGTPVRTPTELELLEEANSKKALSEREMIIIQQAKREREQRMKQ